MDIDSVIDVVVQATGASPTRDSFNIPLLFGYHNRWQDRTRVYRRLSEMITDGFRSSDPLYKMAAKLKAQNPSISQWKVGRRVTPFAQVIELTPVSPALGTVYQAVINGTSVSYTALESDDTAAVCAALASAINTAVGDEDSDAIHTGGSTTGTQTITSFSGVVGGNAMLPERALEFAFSSSADWDATTITVTGKNRTGQIITETFAVPNNGNATVKGTKLFGQVTSVSIPAQSGTGGTFTLGTVARVTATSSSTKVTLTTYSAGKMTTVSCPTKPLNLGVFDATADPGIATDLDGLLAVDSSWYGLLLDSNSKAEVVAAGNWATSNNVFFAFHTADTAVLATSGSTDVFSVLKAANVPCNGIFHASIGEEYAACAWVGNRFIAAPGSDTWAFKTLAGITVDDLTSAQVLAALGRRGNVYVTLKGLDKTYADPDNGGAKQFDGVFIDFRRGLDWLIASIQTDAFAVVAGQADKLAMDDEGIDLVVGAVRAVLNEGIRVKFLAADPAPVVTAPKASEISSGDRTVRRLPDIEFSAYSNPAIHGVQIRGTVIT